MTFKQAAEFCVRLFGTQYDSDEGFFICPECGEPIYKEDWGAEETNKWNMCPVCETYWNEME